MKKIILFITIAVTVLHACKTVTIKPLYIVEYSEVHIDSFSIPKRYNQIANYKMHRLEYCDGNIVQLCRQVDSVMKFKLRGKTLENIYMTQLINDSILKMKVDILERYTKGNLYGGGALLYIRKKDGEILYLERFK